MNSILSVYKELSSLKPVSLETLIEERLNLLLSRYEESLQISYDNIQRYDTLAVVKELSKNAKFM